MSDESLFRRFDTCKPAKEKICSNGTELLKSYGLNKQNKENTFHLLPSKQGGQCRGDFLDMYSFNSETQECSPLSGDATVRKSILQHFPFMLLKKQGLFVLFVIFVCLSMITLRCSTRRSIIC